MPNVPNVPNERLAGPAPANQVNLVAASPFIFPAMVIAATLGAVVTPIKNFAFAAIFGYRAVMAVDPITKINYLNETRVSLITGMVQSSLISVPLAYLAPSTIPLIAGAGLLTAGALAAVAVTANKLAATHDEEEIIPTSTARVARRIGDIYFENIYQEMLALVRENRDVVVDVVAPAPDHEMEQVLRRTR